MRAGRLRHSVWLREPVTQAGDDGQLIPVTTDGERLAAEVVEVGGSEFSRNLQINQETTTLVTIRWRPGVTPGLLFRHDGRDLNIIACGDKDGRRREIVCQCREVKAP